ncbi:MAG: hydrogenase [Melioribacteraceae bacterium]|nr:hydrogenase [Melioribacteraceae bacterium]MCF8355884.1 hydrogenase [Melioribacteraceae bacterium]MCF8395207.1 hydrogenase [Melioribacteraceae bacterium]MCF8420681.1 hydrogenase [Melioribacteraceae bacterium]
MNIDIQSDQSRKLIRFGVLLFLLGLITGFLIPLTANPRMGLSSHLEGTLNGMLLIIFGVIWTKLNLSGRLLKWSFGLLLFGTFTNWATTLFAAIWGAGSEMMPIAGAGYQGTLWQEIIIKFGLISLSISMIIVSGIVLWGIRGKVIKTN